MHLHVVDMNIFKSTGILVEHIFKTYSIKVHYIILFIFHYIFNQTAIFLDTN